MLATVDFAVWGWSPECPRPGEEYFLLLNESCRAAAGRGHWGARSWDSPWILERGKGQLQMQTWVFSLSAWEGGDLRADEEAQHWSWEDGSCGAGLISHFCCVLGPGPRSRFSELKISPLIGQRSMKLTSHSLIRQRMQWMGGGEPVGRGRPMAGLPSLILCSYCSWAERRVSNALPWPWPAKKPWS